MIEQFIHLVLTGTTKIVEQYLKLKKGLDNFRGKNVGIGTSFADNGNEFNIKGRIIGKIFSFPF